MDLHKSAVFLDAHNSLYGYASIKSWIAINRIMDIHDLIFGYPKIQQIFVFPKSNYKYPLIEIQISINRMSDIQYIVFDIRKWNDGYPKIKYWIAINSE